MIVDQNHIRRGAKRRRAFSPTICVIPTICVSLTSCIEKRTIDMKRAIAVCSRPARGKAVGALNLQSSNVATRTGGLHRTCPLGFSSSFHFRIHGKSHKSHLLSRSIAGGSAPDKKDGTVPFNLADIGEGITGTLYVCCSAAKIVGFHHPSSCIRSMQQSPRRHAMAGSLRTLMLVLMLHVA